MTFLSDREFKKWQLLKCWDINIKNFNVLITDIFIKIKLNQIENDKISRQDEGNNQHENSQIVVWIAKRETIKETIINIEVNLDAIKIYRHIGLLDEQAQPCDQIWTDQDQSLQDAKQGA